MNPKDPAINVDHAVQDVSTELSKQPSSFATRSHAQAMAVVLDLSIKPEWEASVLANLNLLESAAEQVLSFDLTDDIEPAVVFSTR